MGTTPEQQARRKIDRLLEQCGWIVEDYRDMNISGRRRSKKILKTRKPWQTNGMEVVDVD